MKRENDKRAFYFQFGHGRDLETIDECRACDFESDRKWRWEADRMRREYMMAGMTVRLSQRACAGRNK